MTDIEMNFSANGNSTQNNEIEINTPSKQIIIKLNKDLLDIHFTEGQIKAFMKEYNFNYTQSVLYLWFFNNVSISPKDLKTDAGRPMYRAFAESVKDLFEVGYDR